MADQSTTPFKDILDALLDQDHTFNPRFLYRLSDLNDSEVQQLSLIWSDIPEWRREALMQDIEQLSEDDTLLYFKRIAELGLQDTNDNVRLSSVRTLWEYEEVKLVPTYLTLVVNDQSEEVRAAAASALGAYVYLGELDEIPPAMHKSIEEQLIQIYRSSEPAVVRRNALESLGYSSSEEIIPFIEAEYHSGDKNWIASALFAMGRSANSSWRPHVQEMLNNPYPNIRAEAARAAGELEMIGSTPRLIELLDDPDDQTRLASIWSLSQLGGDGVRKTLENLLNEAQDDAERNYIESALDNLQFNEDMDLLPLIDFSDMEVPEFDKTSSAASFLDFDELDFDEDVFEVATYENDAVFEDELDDDFKIDLDEIDWDNLDEGTDDEDY